MVLIPESKNAVPALVDGSVPRPRLLATLDGDGRVTLVCAPSGCNAGQPDVVVGAHGEPPDPPGVQVQHHGNR
jgi:hypothetical protein